MSRPSRARVDVLVPVRAPAPWLPETLASLSAQTMDDWRLVAVVDGPDAEVQQQLEDFGASQIVIEESRGLPYALNMGLSACDAEFVARLDSDDRCWPERFAEQTAAMSADPDLALLGSTIVEIDEDGNSLRTRRAPTGASLIRGMKRLNKIAHPSVMLRTEVIKRLGGYNPRAIRVEDYDLWLRVGSVAKIDNLPQPLLDYRMHPGQEWRRPIPEESLAALGRSRRLFSRAHGGSVRLADLRQAYWAWRRSGR